MTRQIKVVLSKLFLMRSSLSQTISGPTVMSPPKRIARDIALSSILRFCTMGKHRIVSIHTNVLYLFVGVGSQKVLGLINFHTITETPEVFRFVVSNESVHGEKNLRGQLSGFIRGRNDEHLGGRGTLRM